MRYMILVLVLAALLAGCGSDDSQIANPAAVYCVEDMNGAFVPHETPEGTAGYCRLPDGRICEEWALFRSGGQTCDELEP